MREETGLSEPITVAGASDREVLLAILRVQETQQRQMQLLAENQESQREETRSIATAMNALAGSVREIAVKTDTVTTANLIDRTARLETQGQEMRRRLDDLPRSLQQQGAIQWRWVTMLVSLASLVAAIIALFIHK